MKLIDRRKFIGNSLAGVLVSATGGFPYDAFVNEPNLTKLTILHTNDVHSRIDPFPMDSGRNAGMGGFAKRAHIVNGIRKREKNVLLFDSGDIFQGTPYFNLFKGELEMKLMSKLRYDAGTMGNHDFDAGIVGFSKQMSHADFPFVVSNYGFDDTILKDRISKYKIFNIDGVKIGVIGLGIELDGLVPPSLYLDTIYEDPIKKAQHHATLLKEELNCDYVVCLSHLGFKYDSGDRPSDIILAQESTNIDLILGGHTHTFLRKPVLEKNKAGKSVMINQVGFGGILLGRIDLIFEKNRKHKCITCKNEWVK